MHTLVNPNTNHFRQVAKRIASTAPFRALGSMVCGLGSCLLYHRVLPKGIDDQHFATNLLLQVTLEDFERQIEYIARNHNPVSLPGMVDLATKSKLPFRSIAVTFDDGYLDNLLYALPVLEKFEVPATIFITTGLVDRTSPIWWHELEFIIRNSSQIRIPFGDTQRRFELPTLEKKEECFRLACAHLELLATEELNIALGVLRDQCKVTTNFSKTVLNWDQIRTLHNHPLITIGAHTSQHLALRSLSEQDLINELRVSKEQIEREVGAKIEHFAYPYGRREHAGKREYKAVSMEGYKSGVTTKPGHLSRDLADNLFAIPRITIDYFDGISGFKRKISGVEKLLEKIRS